ncbi:MAG: hypothetical protein KDK27_16250 [Leptospiraceae bacterium]|nr:hypothetical protein [Leptospiraceae bacterium]
MSENENEKKKRRSVNRELPAATDSDDSDAEQEDVPVEDPHAMYSDPYFHGEADSAWEKFRRFAHNHKRKVYFVFLIGLVLSFVVIMRNPEPENLRGWAENYFARFNDPANDWKYNIAQYYVDRQHLSLLYPILARYTWGDAGAEPLLNNGELYDQFVRDQYETDLLVYAALREEILQTPEASYILENAMRHAIAEYYLYTRIRSDDNNFRVEVDDREALEFYERNEELYADNGLGKNANIQLIKNTLAGIRRDQIRQQLAGQRSAVLEQLKEAIGPRLRPADAGE